MIEGAIADITYIPSWFFAETYTRLIWYDLLENWIYIEVDCRCPHCNTAIKIYILCYRFELEDLCDIIRCSCGHKIGYEILNEVKSFLNDIDCMLQRIEEERTLSQTQ